MVASPKARGTLWPRRLVRICLAFAILGPADCAATEKPLVILFGGYGATEADMRLWEQSAANDPLYGKVFAFEGIAYPNAAGSSVMRAVVATKGRLDALADRLRAMPGRRIIVAGHSSGAGLAVSAVSRIGTSATVKLISLDAGINTALPPAAGFFPITNLECWSAADGEMVSFGYRRAEALCRDHFFVLHIDRCHTSICLHYALVNRRPAVDLTFKQSRTLDNEISGGYADFAVNLDWLAHSQ